MADLETRDSPPRSPIASWPSSSLDPLTESPQELLTPEMDLLSPATPPPQPEPAHSIPLADFSPFLLSAQPPSASPSAAHAPMEQRESPMRASVSAKRRSGTKRARNNAAAKTKGTEGRKTSKTPKKMSPSSVVVRERDAVVEEGGSQKHSRGRAGQGAVTSAFQRPTAAPVKRERTFHVSPTAAEEEECVARIHKQMGGQSRLRGVASPTAVRAIVLQALAACQDSASDAERVMKNRLHVVERRAVRTVTNRGAAVRSRARQRSNLRQLEEALEQKDTQLAALRSALAAVQRAVGMAGGGSDGDDRGGGGGGGGGACADGGSDADGAGAAASVGGPVVMDHRDLSLDGLASTVSGTSSDVGSEEEEEEEEEAKGDASAAYVDADGDGGGIVGEMERALATVGDNSTTDELLDAFHNSPASEASRLGRNLSSLEGLAFMDAF